MKLKHLKQMDFAIEGGIQVLAMSGKGGRHELKTEDFRTLDRAIVHFGEYDIIKTYGARSMKHGSAVITIVCSLSDEDCNDEREA